jgi:flagellar hook-associated protein 1 FlgK
LAQFRAAWHDLANNPASVAARDQVLARGNTLADAVRSQSHNVDAAADAQRLRLVSTVNEVNSAAAGLADANRAIAVGSMNGADVNVLLDTRDQLALRLAELTGGSAKIRPDGGADFTVAGVALVSGKDAGRLGIATGVTPSGTADGSPVTFTVTTNGTSTAVTGPLGGEGGALTDLVDVTLPAYRSGLDAVAKQLADTVNAQHQSGWDATGSPGLALFSYDPADPSGSLAVALTSSSQVAFSGVAGGGLDTGNADALAGTGAIEGAYQQLVSGFGTAVLGARRAAANQQALTNQFDGVHEQLAGVNLDEEMVSMMAAQRAYEAASRVLTTVDSVLDTLINRTGLVR